MLPVAKAHAYGNDFLFVPAEQVEGLRLDELSRRLCERHTGLGGDGVIYYTIAPDGTAQMKLVNTDGSPSELSGNGLRCLAALVLYRREQLRRAPMTEVRVDTDEAGWKALSLISRLLGTVLPGPGTILLGQELRYRRPVHVGDRLWAFCASGNAL